ncbi:hypothetical protein A9267_18015 [Shewanella sp. UCD-FRSSP16_17]|uniref:DUF4198 domain-containing protein n=1 Tax=Shewanella sp. UCD-FRSSP16_17 TaxID=1853256 RepID=UPI0007EEAA17|nr:DUF4198 domain-containing protein [Shewanella sp. UCD-FRSSP16_17]OBT04189.1 hypothetical protein A9267_18015 [Shewanella sp. UCD-FRSSP16_17]
MSVNVKLISRAVVVIASVFAVFTSTAHERFILPSHTLLSGEAPQSITVLASISNDIFHPDRPLGDSGSGRDVGELKEYFANLEYTVIAPDGKVSLDTQWAAYSRMSVADVTLAHEGTYRVGLVQPDVFMTTFVNAEGQPARLWGPSPEIPAGATKVVRRTTASRVETFVTLNSVTQQAIAPTGTGVEIVSKKNHPNDLFANETAQFQLLFNGKPLTTNTKVKLIKAGTRHRNDRDEQILDVSQNGDISFTPSQAGFYLLIAETHVNAPDAADIDVKHFSLYLTLEVFPE